MIPTYVLYTYHAIWCLTPDFTGWSPELCWSPDKLPPPRCISNGLCTPALWPGWCWQTDHLCLRVRLLVPPFHVQYVYYIYIHICKYDFKYVCNICTSSIDSGTCTRIWSYVHMEGCGLGWAVNVCWDLRTDLKLFQAGGTLPWCLQAHQNIKLLEVQAITRPWHSHVCQNVKFRNWVTPRKKLTQRLRHKIHMTYENTPWDTIVLYITKDTRD